MQVQRVQNNNNYNTNFGATLKINTNLRKMKEPVIEFLETQFPKRTKNVSGNLELNLNGNCGFTNHHDTLHYTNKDFHDSITLDRVDLSEPKENLLNKLVNSLGGFQIREKAQNRINRLKDIILETADKAYYESEKAFKNEKAFPVLSTFSPSINVAKKEDAHKILEYTIKS